MQPEQLDLVQQALARCAADITRPGGDVDNPPLWQRLEQLTRAAVDNVPGADHVVLTLRGRDGVAASHAPTSPAIAELDGLQTTLGEGPCLDALRSGTSRVVEVRDFTEERERWPRFAAAAVERGMAILVSFAMAPDGMAPGAVNFYSHTRAAFDETSTMIAGAFATQAAIAFYGARRIADLQYAVQTRDVIGQAKGILMQRHRVDAERAFGMLVRASQDTNVKLVDVARWLTADVGGPASPEG